MDILNLIGRDKEIFTEDIVKHEKYLTGVVSNSSFMVIGGAGSIGQAVVKEIFKRKPKKLHVVDISENNMVELVRDIRSTLGYIEGDFRTFAIDCGSLEFQLLMKTEQRYDYVLNLSALKHVRSEKDYFTLMRMIDVNILNTIKTVEQSISTNSKKYFCVSTDKAANPVNMMGASKLIMEMFLMELSSGIDVSTARFANVAFSDGSLLHGFNQRIAKGQPIAAPDDVRRYFVTPGESGELCLMSCLLGDNGDIFFPKLSENLHLIKFSEIAVKYLESLGYEPFICSSEDEARSRIHELVLQKKWPCYFFTSDTTGEKDFEEFYTEKEVIDLERFSSIGVIKNCFSVDIDKLHYFKEKVSSLKNNLLWDKDDLVDLFKYMIPDFGHRETNKYLDQRM